MEEKKNAQSNQELNLWYIWLEFIVDYSEIAVHTTKYRETYSAFLCIAVEESFFPEIYPFGIREDHKQYPTGVGKTLLLS